MALIRGSGLLEAAELTSQTVQGYFQHGCAWSKDENRSSMAGVGMSCNPQTGFVKLEIPPAFRKKIGDANASAMAREFTEGLVTLGIHEAAKKFHCWQPYKDDGFIMRGLETVAQGVSKIWNKTYVAFNNAPVLIKDMLALNALVQGTGAGIIFGTGVPSVIFASSWLAWRFSEEFLSKLDSGDACIEGALAMSGVLELSPCSVIIEKAWMQHKKDTGATEEQLEAFVDSVLASGTPDKTLKNCIMGQMVTVDDVKAASQLPGAANSADIGTEYHDTIFSHLDNAGFIHDAPVKYTDPAVRDFLDKPPPHNATVSEIVDEGVDSGVDEPVNDEAAESHWDWSNPPQPRINPAVVSETVDDGSAVSETIDDGVDELSM